MASSGNFSTWNPLRYSSTSGITYSDGNCKVETTGGYPVCMNNFAPKSGKWYIEFYNHENNGYNILGIVQQSSITKYGNWLPDEVHKKQYLYYSHNGNKASRNADGSGSSDSYGSSWGSGNALIGCALDLDNGKVWWAKDGTWQASGDPAAGSNSAFDDLDTSDGFFMAFSDYNGGADGIMGINCGQDSTFGGAITAGGNADGNGYGDFKYSPPSGFLALCSANLPISEDIDPAETDDDYPSKQFNCTTYTGNSTDDRAVSLAMAPDLVVVKERGATNNWYWFDSTRGGGVALNSNLNSGTHTDSGELKTFTSTGFTLGTSGGTNNNNDTYAAWGWKANGGTTASNSDGDITSTVQANQKAGFSIMKWTGNGSSNQTIGHGLGAVPDIWIVKNKDSSGSWRVGLNTTAGAAFALFSGANDALKLDGADAVAQMWQPEGNFTATSTTCNTPNNGNSAAFFTTSGDDFIGYCWKGIEGYSKFGVYEGNGNADGPFVYTGFRPRMVILKDADRTENWVMFDSERNTYNPIDKGVFPNADSAETTGSGSGFDIDFLSNGFKLRASHDNMNGSSTYVYACWGDVPFKYNNTF